MAVGELGGHHKNIIFIYFADDISIYVYLYSIVYDGIITPRCFSSSQGKSYTDQVVISRAYRNKCM